MISNKEDLQKALDNLKSNEDRLKTWTLLLEGMFDLERENLEFALNCGSDFYNASSRCQSKINYYSSRLSQFVDRLEYVPRYLYQMSLGLQTSVDISEFVRSREIAEDDMNGKVKTMIADAIGTYFEKQPSDIKKYINDCKSMCTGFLFQPPIIPCSMQDKSKVSQAFKGWDSNKWVMDYCEGLNNAFKKMNLI